MTYCFRYYKGKTYGSLVKILSGYREVHSSNFLSNGFKEYIKRYVVMVYCHKFSDKKLSNYVYGRNQMRNSNQKFDKHIMVIV